MPTTLWGKAILFTYVIGYWVYWFPPAARMASGSRWWLVTARGSSGSGVVSFPEVRAEVEVVGTSYGTRNSGLYLQPWSRPAPAAQVAL